MGVESRDAAIKQYNQFGKLDPYPEIAPSLLNSADISDYAQKTGMIFPFRPEHLKPASYGIMPNGEYIYWETNDRIIERNLNDIQDKDSEGDRVFILKRNSIAFVGLEPEFRFPDYIAARFNLKIKHIYQGLLLGTGPLVDPGFQGKIYIPLHNLTNNEYKIKIEKPIIWMEFTKLSSNKSWDNGYDNKDRQGVYIPFDPEKIKQKTTLKNYLSEAYNAPILSTIQGLQNQIDKNVEQSKFLNDRASKSMDDASKALTSFNRAIMVSFFAIIISLAATIYQTIAIHNKTIDYLREYDKRQNDEHSKFMNEESGVIDLKKQLIDLDRKIKKQDTETKTNK